MTTAISFGGVTYNLPDVRDAAWGPTVQAYLIALSTKTLQASGGSFPLTSADLDFGSNYGLVAKYFKTKTASPATAGFLRLSDTDTIDWRVGSTNYPLGVASAYTTVIPTFNSKELVDNSTVGQEIRGKVLDGTYNTFLNIPVSGAVGIISPAQGGSGIANNLLSTVTILGSYGQTITLTGPTSLTFPQTGTLASLAGIETLTNKTIDYNTNNIINLPGGGLMAPNVGGTGIVNNNANTVTYVGAYGMTFTLTNTTAVTFPTTGTLATLARPETFTNKTIDYNTNTILNLPAFGGTLSATQGGTGISNDVANTLSYVGAYGLTITLTNATSVTLPASGTLATLAGSETLTNKALGNVNNVLTGATCDGVKHSTSQKLLTFPDIVDTVVTKTSTDTLTNKTLSSTTNVLTGATADSFKHSTSGNSLTLPDAVDTLVGKATTDAFTNKTFDAAGTGNSLSNIATSMFAANVVDTDGAFTANSDTRLPSQKAVKTYVLSNAGSGGGGVKNYILNPSAKGSASIYWTASNMTPTQENTNVIPRFTTTGTAFKLVTSGASNLATFTSDYMLLDTTDLSKTLAVELAIAVAVAGWTIDVTASATSGGTYTRIPLRTDVAGVTTLPATTGVFSFAVDMVAATPYVKLVISCPAAINTVARTAYFSDILLSPDKKAVVGPVVQAPISYVPVFQGLDGTTSIDIKYTRIGELMRVQGRFTVADATALEAHFGLAGYTTQAPIGTTVAGSWWINSTSASFPKRGTMNYTGSTSYMTFGYDDPTSSATPFSGLAGSSIIPDGSVVSVDFTVPIAEWAGSGTVTMLVDDKQSPMRAGLIQAWPGTTTTIPKGWFVCDGSEKSLVDYPELYAAIGTTWNTAVNPLTGSAQSAPSAGNFRIPNLQGTFLRGVGDFTDNTKDTTLAGFQADQMQDHMHNSMWEQQLFTPSGTTAWNVITSLTGSATSNPTTGNHGTETRPQNVGVYYIIKAFHDSWDVIGFGAATATSSGLIPAYNTISGSITGSGAFTTSGYSASYAELNSTVRSIRWIRIGNQVFVTAKCFNRNTSSAGEKAFDISLPTPSTFTNVSDAHGMTSGDGVTKVGFIYANTAGSANTVTAVVYVPAGTSDNTITMSFSYEVK